MSFGTKGCMYCEGECNKECLPSQGVFYPEGTEIKIRAAAEEYAISVGCDNGTADVDFIVGANYMAERMYSEEDLRKSFHVGRLYQGRESDTTFEGWFEQIFKKK